jgi:hypothetical protein
MRLDAPGWMSLALSALALALAACTATAPSPILPDAAVDASIAERDADEPDQDSDDASLSERDAEQPGPSGRDDAGADAGSTPVADLCADKLIDSKDFVEPHPGKVVSYTKETPYQNGSQSFRVLLPDSYSSQRRYRVLYVLPVETGNGGLFGDGLKTLESLDAHNQFDLIVVQPNFAVEPWYGDHATDSHIRQASYLVEYLVPFIERSYSVAACADSRLLLGFSKSGWGAFSLIMKYPDVFGYAAAWDAPWMLDNFAYGMQNVFGTKAQLDGARPDLLAKASAARFREATRLVLTGEFLWGNSLPPSSGSSHTVEYHALLEDLGIRHLYDDQLSTFHVWSGAWVSPTLAKLMSLVK